MTVLTCEVLAGRPESHDESPVISLPMRTSPHASTFFCCSCVPSSSPPAPLSARSCTRGLVRPPGSASLTRWPSETRKPRPRAKRFSSARCAGAISGPRARAARGRRPASPSQPNTFYAGFDNGGVWRSTDYGANWVPIFDGESTGSIGAIAVAPSNPDVIYVGTGAGIIRPDLAIGNGVYKSTDAGRTWQHLGLKDSQMIAAIAVDPTNADRLFVAVLGHPYGPNPERGVFRSTDGGRSFDKVLFKDDYTSANEVLIDPRNPNVVYATLWQQQQSFIEGQGFGGAGMGIFKSSDGGTTWTQLTEGLPQTLQANIAIAAERSEHPLRRRRARAGTGRFLQVHRRRRALGARAERSETGDGTAAGPAADGAHRRRRSAHRRRRPEGSERRLHRVHGDVADARWRRHVECGARRAGRRRLSTHLDQPRQSRHHLRRRRPGRGGLRESRQELEQLVQPEHRRDVSRHARTTRIRIASAPGSRTRAARACRADRTMGGSRFTTGIR